MREHELFTYVQNEKLKKENDQLQAQNTSILENLAQKEEEEHRMTQTIEGLCAELPRCNIQLEAPLLHKVKSIVGRDKELEEIVERMDVEYKYHITELEDRRSTMPLEQHKERTKELKALATTIMLHLHDTQNLLDETTTTWATMEEIEDLVTV